MKQNIYQLAILTLFTSTIAFSCNKSDPKVDLKSNTLKLTNYTYKINEEYKSNFELIYPYLNTFPVSLNNKIQVGNNYLQDNEYTYNLETGEIIIPKEYVKDKITITVEATNNSDYGYEAQIILDEHVKAYIYNTEDYTGEPYVTSCAYSRNKTSGELTKDGTGEINIKVVPDDGYDIDIFWVRGLHDKVLDRSATNKDIHTITNIRSNLEITITTKKIYCRKFASKDNLNDKSIRFDFTYRNPENVAKTTINVTNEGISKTYETTNLYYEFTNLNYDTKYDFSFTPTLKDSTLGDTFTCSRYLLDPSTNLNIPHLEFNTENNIFPEKKTYRKQQRSGTSVNNEYVLTNINFVKSDGTTIYSSPTSLTDKIKTRGNYSIRGFNKYPYKLKLNKKFDLLEPFRASTTADNTHKEWVLLPCDNDYVTNKEGVKILNTGLANALCEYMDFEYKPVYQFVGVYINGDYQGLYMLAEQATRGSTSAGKEQGRYKIDKDGFIIENDLFSWSEDISFKTNLIYKCEYTFKYPDPDDFNEDSECYKYIKNYVNKFENELKNSSTDCFKYFDITSLARFLMFHEICRTNDPAGSNIFVIKKNMKDDSILQIGTPWDFDSCFIENVSSACPLKSSSYFYYPKLLKFDVFKTELKNIYSSKKDHILDCVNDYLSTIDETIFNPILNIEAKRWNVAIEEQVSIEDQKSTIANYMQQRLTYLNNTYGN